MHIALDPWPENGMDWGQKNLSQDFSAGSPTSAHKGKKTQENYRISAVFSL